MISLSVHHMPSPTGALLVVVDAAGVLHAVEWADHEPRMLLLLRRYHQSSELIAAASGQPCAATAALDAYFKGDIDAPAGLHTAPGGTVFQRRVWAALRAIPPGATTSYGILAASIGAPAAIRAVGATNGANPVSLVVPCHRVVAADGALTGYGSGIARKRWLLDHERAHAGNSSATGSIAQSDLSNGKDHPP
jgi:methylated-DNA-[protein]-cysteine S-methyltransferase